MNHPVLPSFWFAAQRQHPQPRAGAAALALVLVLAGLLGPLAALAQAAPPGVPAMPPKADPAAVGVSQTAESDLSEGEVVRWDPRTGKVTLRHGPIRNLDMPPMTMVFVVKGSVPTAALTPGAKLRFRAQQQQGAYVITHAEPAP
jgi:Cu/Ag efflux protein CusF